MQMDKVAGSHNDEFCTPAYAVQPILPYVEMGGQVWCPFDTAESQFVKLLRAKGCNVTYTHIKYGQDFFQMSPEGVDYIISNPPYSCKWQVFQRLFDLDIPFAMLVGVVGLFESQPRFDMFKGNDFEIMYFNKRVSYSKSYADPESSLNPPFSSVYVCHHMLPKQIMFAEINKGKR